jgi:hypothetical protein
MKNTVKFLCVLSVILCFGVCAAAAEAALTGKEKRDYRAELGGGMWHASPVLGSGWSNRLAFLEEGVFVYAASTMDGESRERFIAGEWTVSEGGTLTLLIIEVLRWEGGRIAPPGPSMGTKTEIADAEIVREGYDPPRKAKVAVGEYVYDDSTPRPWKIRLPDGGAIWGGDGWWWKYEGDSAIGDLLHDYRHAAAEAALAQRKKDKKD